MASGLFVLGLMRERVGQGNHLIVWAREKLYLRRMRYSARSAGLALAMLWARAFAWAQAPATTDRSAPKRREFHTMSTAIGDDYFDGKDTKARVRRHLAIAR